MARSQVQQSTVFDPALPDRSAVAARPSAAQAVADPDHHLWRNGRLWWIAFTVHLPGWKKERVRLSLRTADVAEARRRRDQLLREYPLARGCELSLRLTPVRRPARSRLDGPGTRQPTVAA